MQTTGQYGVTGAYAAPHNHIFNLSHEMSLPPSAGGHVHAGHSAAAGQSPNGLSLSQYPHTSTQQQQQQQLFLQSRSHQQQHAADQFPVTSMGAAPKAPTAQTSSLLYPNQAACQTHSQSLQSAAQQLQADINHHQQHQHQQPIQPITADNGQHIKHQQSAIAVHAQKVTPPSSQSASQQQVQDGKLASEAEGVAIKGGETMISREEQSLDGDEQDVLIMGDDGERAGCGGGNRWPRQEAIALLKIRSDMDAAFRDSSLKGPLWEEVSRKLAEIGYRRSAKKCKEKFENVHKYYKRTKDGKTGRQDGKSYRFYTQLEALYSKAGDVNSNDNSITMHSDSRFTSAPTSAACLSCSNTEPLNASLGPISALNHETHLHGAITAGSAAASAAVSAAAAAAAAPPTNAHVTKSTLERKESIKLESDQNSSGLHFSYLESSDDDADDYDEDEFDEDPATIDTGSAPASTPAPPIKTGCSPATKKRKRESTLHKYLSLFERVLQKVLDKQEHMQQRFLEALEKRDQDRMMREEAWRRQEMARLNQEHDIRVAERTLSASRDASLIALLQKVTGQTVTLQPTTIATLHPTPINIQHSSAIVPVDYMHNEHQADKDIYDPSNKRWPKSEVLALIKLRVHLDARFHEPGSKAVLWDEISAGMAAQGFINRTAKRCKEKWENINKYFKKARESSKIRSENAKTCPYFHHLEALYKEGLLRGGGAMASTKHVLMVTEKGEAHSDQEVMDQEQNTSNTRDHDTSGQAGQEAGDPKKVGITTTISMSVCATGVASCINIPIRTNTISTDAAMHLFMSSDQNTDIKEVDMSIRKLTPNFNGSPNSTTESVITGMDRPAVAFGTAQLPRNSDHGMSTSINLSSSGNQPPALEQS